MPSKEFDRTLTGMVSTGLEKVKKIATVGIYITCSECGNRKPVINGGPCPHTHMEGDEDTKVMINIVPPDPDTARPMLTAPVKTVPKAEHKTREERINEVTESLSTPYVERRDGGYRRTTDARAPTQETDPFKTKVDRFCASIAYENSTEQVDEDYIEPVPKYFIERRD